MPSGTPMVVAPEKNSSRWIVLIGNRAIVDVFDDRQFAVSDATRRNRERRGPGTVILNSDNKIDYTKLSKPFWFGRDYTDQIRAPIFIVPDEGGVWKVMVGNFKTVSEVETKEEATDLGRTLMLSQDRPATATVKASGERGSLFPNISFWSKWEDA